MSDLLRRLAGMALVLLVAAWIAPVPTAAAQASANEITFDVPFSTVLRMGLEGKVTRLDYSRRSGTVSAETVDGTRIGSRTPSYESWIGDLSKAGVTVSVADDGGRTLMDGFSSFLNLFLTMSMIVILFAVAIRLKGDKGLLASVGSAPGAEARRTTFADVAGAEEAKRELMETVAFLRDPSRFESVGARIPRGILLVGDPGNGKTLLARAVAGEANAPFLSCAGSDFTEMYVGVGGRRVRSLFRDARRRSLADRVRARLGRPVAARPAILFIDEIDAVGRRRGGGSGSGGDREYDQTLNALLTEMDGLEGATGVVVVAATNRIDVLDPALLRAGRFDRHIVVSAPSVGAREAILGVHARKVRLGKCVDLPAVAKGTPGFSGADLEVLVNEAAIEAAQEGGAEVLGRHFEAARDRKMLGGAERRGVSLQPDEIETVAYHEAGHALVAVLIPGCDPIHKATIVPRGRALGFVARFPETDRVLAKRSKMLADLAVAMAGRAAEEERFGADDVTGGAASDIDAATRAARDMIASHGLGDSLSSRSSASFDVAEGTRRDVDEETERLVSGVYATARSLVSANRAALDALADALRERETLDGDEIRRIVHAHKALPSLGEAA